MGAKMLLKPSTLAFAIFSAILIDRALMLLFLPRGIIFWSSIGIILALMLVPLLARLKRILIVILAIASIAEILNGILQTALFVIIYSQLLILLSGVTAILLGISGVILALELEEVTRRSPLQVTDPEFAVVLENVHKHYYTGTVSVHALRGISLRIRKGEFVAIMGPSGSGKSTLLNIIGALDRPTSGKVYIDGVDVSKLDSDGLAELRNRKIGFIFQAYNLINRTTVLRNIEMPALVAGVQKKKRVENARRLLEIMGLDETALKRRPVYLSGGQQQRVAIARALMNMPAIILADEPTGNLDSKTGAEVIGYLRKLNKELGITVIVVTHDRSVAEKADRILHIRDGMIIREEMLNVGEKSEREAG